MLTLCSLLAPAQQLPWPFGGWGRPAAKGGAASVRSTALPHMREQVVGIETEYALIYQPARGVRGHARADQGTSHRLAPWWLAALREGILRTDAKEHSMRTAGRTSRC